MIRTSGKKRTQWNQWMAGITATMTIVCAGTVNGWATTNLSRLMGKDSPVIITSDQSSWIVSVTGIGVMFGPFIGAASAETFGRKKTLLLTSLFYATGWLMNIFATNAKELYVARVILGTGMGISISTNPMYISEIADVNIRGALSTLMATNLYTGTVFACTIGPFVAIQTLSIILLMVPILFVCLFIWFPETPYYLASKGRYVEAGESLAFFKGISDHQEAKKELEVLIVSIEKRDTSQNWRNRFRDMPLPNNRKALGIIVFLIISQSMSGYSVTKMYLPVLFQKANIGLNTSLATIMVLITSLFSCILTTITIEKVGRRPSIIASTLGTCVILAVLASYFIADARDVDMTSVNWLPVFIIILFQLSYHFGMGPIPNVLIGELFPSNVKSIGSAAVTILYGVCGLLISKFYQMIGDAIGEHVVYYIFSGSCFLAFIFSFAFVPETMNKEFDEIQKDLANNRLRCFKKQDNA